MRVLRKIFFLLAVSGAAVLSGCKDKGDDKAYFTGMLTVEPSGMTFTDSANGLPMPVDEDSRGALRKLIADAVGDSAKISYAVEFYGRTVTKDKYAPMDQMFVMHVVSLESWERATTMPEQFMIAGLYDCRIDEVPQQLIMHPDYIYTWTIFPNKKYEIITRGEWRRTGPASVILVPFKDQTLPESNTEMVKVGEFEVDGDSTRIIPMDEQQTGGAGVIVSQTSSRNEDTIVEVDISGSADPYAMQTLKSEAMARPGITRFTIDAESQTLVEKEKGLLVFWKLYV